MPTEEAKTTETELVDNYCVILDFETGKVIFKKVKFPKDCEDYEAYLYEKNIIKPSECSFMCSDKPIKVVYE